MKEEDKPLAMSDEQVQRLMGVKQRVVQKKSQLNGRGAGLWLTSWGLILFAFEKWIGLADWGMWVCRGGALFLLLMGTLLLAQSFDVQKEQ